jgi:hypothetical protein
MHGKGRVALGRVVLAKRERVVMIEPWDKGLIATALRYPYEIGEAKEYSTRSRMSRSGRTCSIWRADPPEQTTDFDPAQFVDRYKEAVIAMLKKKQAGLPVSREYVAPRPQYVVNLMDALRRSIPQERAASSSVPKGRKRIRANGQGEMLLPIAGKPKKVATAKPAERPGAPAPDRRLSVDPRHEGSKSQDRTCVENAARRAMIEKHKNSFLQPRRVSRNRSLARAACSLKRRARTKDPHQVVASRPWRRRPHRSSRLAPPAPRPKPSKSFRKAGAQPRRARLRLARA